MISTALFVNHFGSFRLGQLAKRLVARPASQMFTAAVAVSLGLCVDWMFEPLQSVAESLLNGHRNALQVGDLMNARVNRTDLAC